MLDGLSCIKHRKVSVSIIQFDAQQQQLNKREKTFKAKSHGLVAKIDSQPRGRGFKSCHVYVIYM